MFPSDAKRTTQVELLRTPAAFIVELSFRPTGRAFRSSRIAIQTRTRFCKLDTVEISPFCALVVSGCLPISLGIQHIIFLAPCTIPWELFMNARVPNRGNGAPSGCGAFGLRGSERAQLSGAFPRPPET